MRIRNTNKDKGEHLVNTNEVQYELSTKPVLRHLANASLKAKHEVSKKNFLVIGSCNLFRRL